MKPGSRNDPWRDHWIPGLGIYQVVLRGKNRAGVEVGAAVAWTPGDPLQYERLRENRRLFDELVAGYDTPFDFSPQPGGPA